MGFTPVRRLQLSRNRLDGYIPTELGDLSSLHVLDLSHNSLKGNIPASLGDMGKLQVLDLSHNRLNGMIPKELGEIVTLQKVDLSHNSLEGMIPKELGESVTLLVDLSHNSLEGPIPINLKMAKFRTTTIILEGNHLTGSSKSDRAALMALFESTNGRQWWTNTHWGTDVDIMSWHGVSVDSDGRVNELSLSRNRLRGE
ncbi:unnamed protein product, partial [Ectocarpus fasciculatus]